MKKTFSLTLALCILLSCFFVFSAEAEEAEQVYYAGTAPVALEPDVDYWIGEVGQLTSPDTKYAHVYDISTAEQLLGLAHVLALTSAEEESPLYKLLDGDFSKKYKLTKGKVFRLTADIDLNTGIDWSCPLEASAQGAVSPVNEFPSLGVFYGTLDGQGHSVTGIYSPRGTGDDRGGLVGSLRGGGVKNLTLGGGYVGGTDGGALGGLIGSVCIDEHTESVIEIKNVTLLEDFTVSCENKTAGAVGGVCGKNSAQGLTAKRTVTVLLENVTFLGSLSTDGCGSAYGYFFGDWGVRENADIYLEMTDCGAYCPSASEASGQWTLTETDQVNNTILNRCLETRAGLSVPSGWETRWINTSYGPLPASAVILTDSIRWQSTDVRQRTYTDKLGVSHNAKTYDVRVVSSVDSLDWGYAGFTAVVKNLTDGSSYTVENLRNRTVYQSIIAGGAEVTASSMGLIKGQYMYCMLIEDLDPEKEYQIEVKTVLTRKDGTFVESPKAKVFTPSPYDLEAAIPKPDIFELVINNDGTATEGISGTAMTIYSGNTAPTVESNKEFGCNEAKFVSENKTAWEYNWTRADFDKMAANGAAMEMFVCFDEMVDGSRPIGNQQNGGLGFNVVASGNQVNFVSVGTSKGSSATYARAYNVPTGEYLHMVGVYDPVNNSTSIYINGELIMCTTPNNYPLGPPESTSDYWMVIGGDSGGGGATSSWFSGSLISANVYSQALTWEQIRLLYANYYYN